MVASSKTINYFGEIPKGLLRSFWIIQLFCAFAICINHLHFNVIKGIRFSSFWETQPTLFGITFLAFSTGLLTQLTLKNPISTENFRVFISRRYIRMFWPIFLAVTLDLLFFMPESGDYLTTLWPLLSVFTLSQTWIYNVFDAKSIPLPLSVANLTWVGSSLFGLFVLHGVTKKLLVMLTMHQALIATLITSLFCALYFSVINSYEESLSAWALAKYGSLAGPYQFVNWLYLYNPFAEIGSYFCGVAFAQLIYIEKYQINIKTGFTLAMVSLLLMLAVSSTKCNFD